LKYDPDSDLTATIFPTGTTNEDKYAFNEADQQTLTEAKRGTETLASLSYTRDNAGQLKTTKQTGLPGEAETSNTYDENNRLTKGGATAYEYDAADNPTKTGSSTNTYNEADEITKGTGVEYSYDEIDERTKRTPISGPATTYGYDEAGNLTTAERPKEGEVSEIKDSYAYNGEGLRTSQTISGATNYLTWQLAASLPLLLNDGANSYIYGPEDVPIEQIATGGTVLYLHHDQQGSTRLLTGSIGTKEASMTFDAYGNTTGTTGTATTPLGYDAQYTSPDTGLIYLRARSYDPATAQFLSVDPLEMHTREPYGYVSDNPLNGADRSGLSEWEIELPCVWPFCGPPPHAVEGLKEFGEGVIGGAEITWQEVEHGWNAVFSTDNCGIPRSAIDAEAALKEIAGRHDIPRKVLHDRLDRAKKGVGMRPKDKTRIDVETGEIYDAETGEQLGNVYEH
jgi:RHS repeat-associated protein